MNWIILCLLVALLYAISAFIDNYITDVLFKGRLPQAVKVSNCVFYPATALLIALVFGVQAIPFQMALVVFASGAIHSCASLPYFLALRDEETTTAATYFQLLPIICFFADIFLLGKVITNKQIIALAIIILALIVIAIAERKGKRNRKKHLRGSLLLLAYVLIASVSTIIFSHVASFGFDYWSIVFWYVLGRAFFDTTGTIAHKSWRKRFKEVIHAHPVKTMTIILSTSIIYTAGDFIFRYALGLTNSSFASAVANASELIITFLLGIILTLIRPKFGREKLDKRNVMAHLIAVIMVTTSIILIQ
jgi:drug/metabolite transporter (DMT)-like permease